MFSVCGCGDTESRSPISDGDSEDVLVTAVDTVSARLVESRAPQWNDGGEWKLSDSPSLVIGEEIGPKEYQLFRVQGAARLDDGTVVVANAGTRELRFFDAGGRHVRSVGTEGQGPGEFSMRSSLRFWRTSDGDLVVSDEGNGRVNVVSVGGDSIISVKLEPAPQAPRGFLWGVFGDGSWLVAAPEGGGVSGGRPGSSSRSSFKYLRYDESGAYVSQLVRLAHRPRYVHEHAGTVHYPYVPLTAEPLLATAGDFLYVIAESEPKVQKIDVTGKVAEVFVWSPRDQPLVADVWDDYKRTVLNGIEDEGRRNLYAAYYEQDLPMPDRVPVAEALRLDPDGNVWVLRFSPLDEGPRQWDVIGADGRWIGSVDTPENLDVFEIGATYILGIWLDDVGVERVVLFDLVKP